MRYLQPFCSLKGRISAHQKLMNSELDVFFSNCLTKQVYVFMNSITQF